MTALPLSSCGCMTRETERQHKTADSNPATRDQLMAAVQDWQAVRPDWVVTYSALRGWKVEQMPADMLADLLECVAWCDAWGLPVWEFLTLKRNYEQ